MGIAKNVVLWVSRRVGQACRGQMTVELAVTIPVLIALAVVVCNAMLFLENCAAFDRLAKDAVRVYATAPGYGQTSTDCAALVNASLQQSFTEDYLDIAVTAVPSGAFVEYQATLSFTPTLFGRSFSGAVFDVVIPRISHTARLVVDPYKPGALL